MMQKAFRYAKHKEKLVMLWFVHNIVHLLSLCNYWPDAVNFLYGKFAADS
jgi:hypothetical protein